MSDFIKTVIYSFKNKKFFFISSNIISFKIFLVNNIFCGQINYVLDGDKTDDIIIFNSQKKTFPNDKYLHCHYIIDPRNKAKHLPYLYYELSKNNESNEPRLLKFEFSTIYTYTDKDDIVETITNSKLRSSNTLKANLEKGKIIDVFLDFLDVNYNKPEEILQLKIVFENKSGENGNSSNTGTIAGSISGVLGGLVLIGIIAYCCCSKKQNQTDTDAGYVVTVQRQY
jgi:hypothetical protein